MASKRCWGAPRGCVPTCRPASLASWTRQSPSRRCGTAESALYLHSLIATPKIAAGLEQTMKTGRERHTEPATGLDKGGTPQPLHTARACNDAPHWLSYGSHYQDTYPEK